MNKIYSITILFLLFSLKPFAQTAPVDTSWKTGGFFGLNFSQVNLSHWQQGGNNSIAFGGNLNVFANYVKGKTDWQNSLIMAYGTVKTGTDRNKKSDDKIDFTSQYGRKFAEHWQYAIGLNFKSQFASGFNYPNDTQIVSKFFSPAYLTLGPGIIYKPVDYFEIYFSPATVKWTFVMDQSLADGGAYGVDPGETIRTEFGAYLTMKFKKDIMQNVNLYSKIEFFNNYSDKDPDNAKKVDVNWDNALIMTVNKYITASVTAQVIYDADVIEKTQFKESIGVGFGYKF